MKRHMTPLSPEPVLSWLLEENNPSARYRTLVELLDHPTSASEPMNAHRAIAAWGPVREILQRMSPGHYWSATGKNKSYGAGLDYYGYVTTPHMLRYLAEMGITRDNAQADMAARRYLDILDHEHGFKVFRSCIDAYALRSLAMMGYEDHPVFRRLLDLMLSSIRWDNGYQCGRESKTRPTKSCFRGTWQALIAFADIKCLQKTPEARHLVHYFIDREVLYRLSAPSKLLRGEVKQTIFPFVHGRGSLLEPLYALSKMGWGKHPALERAWAFLEQKKMPDGRYVLDWSPAAPFPVSDRGEPDKWVTFYALLALRFRSGDITDPKHETPSVPGGK